MTNTDGGDIRTGDALIVVDVQPDFCPGGALPLAGGDEVVPLINAWIEDATRAGIPVVASRDWHPPEHMSFAPQGGPWPVHCVQGSTGAVFHPALRLPNDAVIVTKGDRDDKDQYSAFDDTGLAADLRRRGVRRVWIAGLALDICVRATALDAERAGFDTHVIEAATRPVTEAGGRSAVAEMRAAGISVE